MTLIHFIEGKKKTFENFPKTPGVYVFRNAKEILYIGKAKDLRVRVKNHFQQPSWRDHLFIDQVQSAGYRETPSEIDALLLESTLIKRHQPKYNVIWKDDKNYFYAAITRDDFPRVFITHQTTENTPESGAGVSNQRYRRARSPIFIGPFVDGKALKQALRYLRKCFPYYTAKNHPTLPCGYCHLGLCPGHAPDRAAYLKNLKNLAAVLRGKRTSVIKNLKKEMKVLAGNRRYERASLARDQIFALERIASYSFLASPEAGARTPPRESYGDIEKSLREMLGTDRPIRRIEEFDISNIQGELAVASMVVFVDGQPAKGEYRKFKIKTSKGMANDFAMMREVIGRRLRHEEWQFPDLLLADGGKGQLSSACKAVEEFEKESKNKFSGIVAALAKQKSEIFLPRRARSVLLRSYRGSVQNLFLRIRDEAHRFAITYHKKLRAKTLLPD